jgi:ABC-type nitrate/sulfonate/bicarbonate transport system permease component
MASHEPLPSPFSHSGAEGKMKAALSLTLILSLMTSALPVTAQERIDRTAGPISRAMTLEAVPLAAERPEVGKQLTPNFARTWSRAGKGALIGFGIGAALGMTVGQEACLNQPRWNCAKVGTPFAVIGAAIAWLHK